MNLCMELKDWDDDSTTKREGKRKRRTLLKETCRSIPPAEIKKAKRHRQYRNHLNLGNHPSQTPPNGGGKN